MAKVYAIEMDCKFDPMFQGMMEEADRDPEWKKTAQHIVDAGRGTHIDFLEGRVLACHPSEELLQAYYEHMEGKP